MSAFLSGFLYVILFLFCLGVLIVIHELGHFAMAKAFNVYCFEFSVGMGPKIFKKKRKNGETYFALRGIPFGGYVSMYGEKESIPEGLEIDPSRSINAIKKWKRLIILAAGVIMNAILALLIFIVTCTCLPQTSVYISPCSVREDSIAEKAGINNGDNIYIDPEAYKNDNYYLLSKGTAIISGESVEIAALLSRSLISYEKLSYNDLIHFYYSSTLQYDAPQQKDEILPNAFGLESVNFFIATAPKEDTRTFEENHFISIHPIRIDNDVIFEEIGISLTLVNKRNSFGEGMKEAFIRWGDSASIVFRGIGALFTNIENIGGIIAIGVQTSNTLANFGWTNFLNLWGLTSVNLAIFNLLPFPGLDGWQILVLLVEMIAHKEIPSKVKNIVSFVGIALLFLLMILILIKDVIGLF